VPCRRRNLWLNSKTLQEFVKPANSAPYKCLRTSEFFDEMPNVPTDKVQRLALGALERPARRNAVGGIVITQIIMGPHFLQTI
jgi:acyl-coenzyme A synthetase/AMP-(fatty) acid ligase